jgi:transposase
MKMSPPDDIRSIRKEVLPMKKGVTFMREEVRRFSVVDAVIQGKMTNKEGAAALCMSLRQLKRIKAKVKKEGPDGVRHGNRGRASPKAFPVGTKEQAVDLAKREYYDFNFSHLSEILEERHSIRINRETLRLWLRPLGFGSKVRRKPRHRLRRERSQREGQMLFLDGSPHRWFGNEKSTLLLSTDDATGNPLYGLFQKEEDLEGCFRVVGEVIARKGIPSLFYLDRASQFTTTRRGGLHVAQRDDQPTQFERAMMELGIRLLFAHSPEARGRGERINETFQDRLVAEFRLHGIATYNEATKYLNNTFIPKYVKRFGVTPRDDNSAWRLVPPHVDIRNILCTRYQRRVDHDNTISVKNRSIQLLPTRTRLHFAKAHVIVNRWIDGSWHVSHGTAGEIPCREIPGRVRPEPPSDSRPASEARASS